MVEHMGAPMYDFNERFEDTEGMKFPSWTSQAFLADRDDADSSYRNRLSTIAMEN